MPAFDVTIETRSGVLKPIQLFATDRDDAIAFVRRNFRRVFKRVKSARRAKLSPGEPCRARQFPDHTMACSFCALVWDANDKSPPKCRGVTTEVTA